MIFDFMQNLFPYYFLGLRIDGINYHFKYISVELPIGLRSHFYLNDDLIRI